MIKGITIVGAIIVVVVLLSTFFVGCERIDAGHEGISIELYGSSKGVQDVTIVTGMVFYNRLTTEIVEYPTYVQTVDYQPFTINSKDGSQFTVDPTISFNVIPGNSPKLYRKFRKDIGTLSNTALLNYTKDAFRLKMNKFTTDEIVSNREQFESEVQTYLSDVLGEEGISLEQMTSGLTYPPSIVAAVDAKNKAVQEAMRVENELKIAEAEARKVIVQAEAERKANELRQQAITPLLLQQQFIEKWDGKLPVYGQVPQIFMNLQSK